MWQKAKTIRTTLYLSIGVITSYSVTYLTKVETRESGIQYFIIMVAVSMGMLLSNKFLKRLKKKQKC